MHLKAYKFRIYPSKEQEVLLAKTFGCCRFVWNKLVENFNSNSKEFINEKTLKDTPEFEFLKEVSAAAIQGKRLCFDEFKKHFFLKLERKNSEDPNTRKNLIGSLLVCLTRSLN